MAEGSGQIFGTILFLLMLLASYLKRRRKQRESGEISEERKTVKVEPSTPVSSVLTGPVGFGPIAILAVIALIVAYVVIDSPELRRWLVLGILLVPLVYLLYKLRAYDLSVGRRS
jgi:hypothetical protein